MPQQKLKARNENLDEGVEVAMKSRSRLIFFTGLSHMELVQNDILKGDRHSSFYVSVLNSFMKI